MNFVESLNLLDVQAKEIPSITGVGAPTTATEGAVGCLYMDTTTGDIYKCTKVINGEYTWKIIESSETNVSSDIEDCFELRHSINRLDPEKLVTGAYIDNTDGEIHTTQSNGQPATGYMYSDFIPVSVGEVITYQCNVFYAEDNQPREIRTMLYVAAYDSLKNILTQKGANSALKYTVPEDVAYIRVSIPNATYFLEQAIVASEEIIPYSEYFAPYKILKAKHHDNDHIKNLISDTVASNKVDTENIKDRAVTLEKQSFILKETANNIYDANTMAIPGAWYNGSGTKSIYEANQYTTNYVAIKIPIDNSKGQVTLSTISESAFVLYSWYMVDGEDTILLKGHGVTVDLLGNPLTLEIPEGTKYLDLSPRKINPQELMVNYGNEVLPYDEYKNVYKLDGKALVTEDDLDDIAAGKDGLTPYIGENGNWWIGEEDTGVRAEGGGGSASIDIEQTTGNSTTAVMSQKAVTDEISEINSRFELSQTANRLNSEALTRGAYIDNRDGEIHTTLDNGSAATGYMYSDFIPVNKGEVITYQCKVDRGPTNQPREIQTMFFVAAYDEFQNILTTKGASSALKYTVPEGVSYIRISISTGSYFSEYAVVACEDIVPYEEYAGIKLVLKTDNYNTSYIKKLAKEACGIEEYKILTLPRRFNLIIGDTFEMFYKGISNVIDSNIYDYEITFSDGVNHGKAWKRNFEWTPLSSDVGTKTMTVVVRDNIGKELDSGSVDLVVSAEPISPTTEKVFCCMGDSLIGGGKWCGEMRRRLVASDGTPNGYGLTNVRFIGSQIGLYDCNYEGHGGWTFDSYLTKNASNQFMNIYSGESFGKTNDDQHSTYTDSNGIEWKLETIEDKSLRIIRVSSSGTLPSSGTLTWKSGGVNKGAINYTSSEIAAGNPFWSDTKNANDFTAYAARMGVSKIDHMIILLGWNSQSETEDSYKSKVRQFIDSLRSEFADCKITLVGLQVPSRDGFANNYGITYKYFTKLQFVWNLNKWYQDIADEYSGVEFVNIAGQFDTEYNCITMTKKPNTRSSVELTVQSNGVHPSIEGYYQIADAVLRNTVALLN